MIVARRHPALHVAENDVSLARVAAGGEVQIVRSDGVLGGAEDAKDTLLFMPRGYTDLSERWDGDDVVAFVSGERTAPTFAELLALAIHALDGAMEFPRPEHRALIATWTVATYFHPLFLTFPRLSLSGEREAGKSKLLALLHALAWNALYMLNPTPAVLFRLVHAWRPTLLLDEVEGLSQDDARDVLAIVNAGYKAGATVARCEGKDQRRVESFGVYAPLALAAIRALNATTEDRCIPVVLQRGTDRARLNAEVDPRAETFTRIRNGCHRLLLTRSREVHDAYCAVALPTWLNGRARELWKPLLALASVADRENGLALTPDLLSLAREHVSDRPGVTVEGGAMLAVLAAALGDAAFVIVHPGELREPLRARLGWREAPSAETAAALLRRLGARREGKDRDGAKYPVTAEWLRSVTERYIPEETVTPSPSHVNPAISQSA